MSGDVPGRFRMMTVHAHPDDESSKGAATCARYAAEGHDVMVVTCTGGERGSILNPAMDTPENLANMPALRQAEMARAAEILGVQHRWLGFVDSGLPEGDPKPALPDGCFAVVDIEESAEALVRLIREFRPHVFVTYDENGGYPHPDHIRTHEVSMVAFDAAGDPDRFPDAGDPWQPLKLYYSHGFSRERFMKIHQAMLDRTGESPYLEWIERWEKADAENRAKAEAEGKEHNESDPDSRVTTRVACGDYFELRDAALKAHATQVDPTGWWFRVPLDLQREVWPTEEYELVRSLVDSTTPEDSLFAGVQERVSA